MAASQAGDYPQPQADDENMPSQAAATDTAPPPPPPPRSSLQVAAVTPPSPPSMSAAEQRRCAAEEVRFDCRLTLCSFTLHTATQITSLLAWPTLPFTERFQRLLSICHALAMYLLPTLTPVFYLRWRAEALAIYRLAFFAFPLLRKARGIQRVLDTEPLPGLHGIAKDLLKVVWGSRLVAIIMSSVLTPLPLMPLVPHLLVQAYSVAMVRHNGTLCAAPLLSHPLAASRIDTFHNLMHLLSLMLPGSVGQSVASALHQLNREQQCEAFMSFLFLTVGLMLPIAFLLKTEPPQSLHAWERAAEEAPAPPASTGAQAQCRRSWHRVLRARGMAQALGQSLEAGLRQLCGRSWLAAPVTRSSSGEWSRPRQPSTQQQGRRGDAAAAAAAAAAATEEWRPPAHRLSLAGWQRCAAWWLVLSVSWALCVELAVPANEGS